MEFPDGQINGDILTKVQERSRKFRNRTTPLFLAHVLNLAYKFPRFPIKAWIQDPLGCPVVS